MWKVPQAVLVREVTLEGGVTQLWPNKDKVVPRIGGSRYVLFTMDNRAQVRRGPSGRSRVAWDVACGRAGCFAASTFIAWSTHLFCGWTRWALPFQAGVRTGGCVLAAFQPYDCETRRMTSVSCLRHSYAGLRLSHTLGRALQRTPSGASIQEVCHSARACAHRTVCFGFCTRPVLLCEGGPADAGQHAAGAARHSRHSSR